MTALNPRRSLVGRGVRDRRSPGGPGGPGRGFSRETGRETGFRGAARRARTLLPALALGLAAAACGGGGDGGEAGAGAASAAAPVETAVARRDTLSTTVQAVGTLEAEARVEVKPERDGHVTSIRFEEGQEVRRGQVLVRLDQNEFEARVRAARAAAKRARARASNLERRLQRNDSLLAAGAISPQTHDDVRTEHESAEAALEEAEANLEVAEQRLEDATIRAPFDGRVGARSFHRGDYVQVGQSLFTLVDDAPLEVRFSVPERYLGHLRVGSPVRISVRSRPGRAVRGSVSFVSPYVDSGSRSVDLEARIPNPASELRAGQFASVELELEERVGVVVPEAAVVPRQDRRLIYLARGGTARRRTVRLGERREGAVEVLSGVSPGDTVVVAGQQRLADGAAISAEAPGGGGG